MYVQLADHARRAPIAPSREPPLEPGDRLRRLDDHPWTLITNAAVAAGPEIEYVRAHLGARSSFSLATGGEHALGEAAEVLAHFPGEALAGTSYEPPFDYITDYGPPGGTRCCSPASSPPTRAPGSSTRRSPSAKTTSGSENDGITLQNPVTLEGTFDERITDFASKVEELTPTSSRHWRRRGTTPATYLHAYPHCWRCDTPLIYYAK